MQPAASHMSSHPMVLARIRPVAAPRKTYLMLGGPKFTPSEQTASGGDIGSLSTRRAMRLTLRPFFTTTERTPDGESHEIFSMRAEQRPKKNHQ